VNIQEKKLENSRMEITVEVPADLIEKEYESSFIRIQKSAKLDGFRPGKAPLAMVKARYQDRADQDVVENIVKDNYFEAIKEKSLSPISYPTFDFGKLTRGQNFTFKAAFDVAPTMTLGSYTGIAVEERTCTISDLDVNEEIESLREQHAIISKKEDGKPVAKGDIAKLKVKRIDHVAPEAAEALDWRDVSVLAGQHQEDYEFDAHVEGMNVGEEKTVSMTYPADYQYKSLAGQTQKHVIRVDEIQKRELPAVDEDFVKDLGTYESVADMKAKIRVDLEKLISQKGRGEAKSEILKKIVEGSSFEIPQTMIDEERESIFKRLCQRIGFQAQSIDQIAPFFGMKAEELGAKLSDEAAQSIKTSLAVGEITKKEELKVSEEQYSKAIAEMSVSMKRSEDELRTMIEKSQSRARVESEILYDAAIEFLYEKAKVKKLSPVALKEFVKN
jgi:trigger factor